MVRTRKVKKRVFDVALISRLAIDFSQPWLQGLLN